jgi:hypothetical protein
MFFSCGDGTLSIYHEKSADDYQDAGAVKTQPSAKTLAFDPSKRPQRSIKPGSFVVLVVGK